MSISQQVSSFVLNRPFEDLPENVITKAKQHIMDAIGVLIAAANDPVAEVIKQYLDEIGDNSSCTVLGLGKTTSILNAALANGILTHGLDYDDSSWRLIGHPSAAVLPAVLAVGETCNSSGKDILTAYVLGTEVSCKLGFAAEPELYEAGWHATGVVGVLGATAACGYLLKLSEEKLTYALGVAASLSCGLRCNIGSMTKPFHAGAAAQHGVTAALLAKNGFTSSINSLDGKWGFFYNFSSKSRSKELLPFGEPFDIVEPGWFVKPYPSCAASHTGIDAMLSLVKQYGFNSEDVISIDVGAGPVGPIMLFHNQPHKGSEGKFSMPFVVAIAILEGKVGLDSFHDSKVSNPRVLDLISKTRFYMEPEFAQKKIDEAPALVKVKLKDGRELIKKVEDPLGSPRNPMTVAQLVEKYRDCVCRLLPEQKVKESQEVLLELEKLTDLTVLTNRVLVP